jgi:hypothetical protein
MPVPTIETLAATLVDYTTAWINANIVSNGGGTMTYTAFWTDLGLRNPGVTQSGQYYYRLLELSPGTTYRFYAKATNIYGNAVDGAILYFTTKGGVITGAVSAVTAFTATGGGDATVVGQTDKGICWGTSVNPTIALPGKASAGAAQGTFSFGMTGLVQGTTYHVRAYAVAADGVTVTYGADESFTTLTVVAPTVETAAITSILPTSASGGGAITSEGNESVDAKGVCWNTTGSPTVADAHTTDGSGPGEFTSALTNLNMGTTYYVRAYATNYAGTGYGPQVSFTTPKFA